MENSNHRPDCYSGTEPLNKCFCKEGKTRLYRCECGDYEGTKHGLVVHRRMKKHEAR